MSSIASAPDVNHQEEHAPVEVQEQPASHATIGIPRRHEHMLDSRVPSTIRMVSADRKLDQHSNPAQKAQAFKTTVVDDAEPLQASSKAKSVLTPFCKYPIKRSPPKKQHLQTESTVPPPSIESVEIKDHFAQTLVMDTEEEDDRPIPGAFPTPPSKRKEAFTFGSNSSVAGISNEEFGIAGDAVLEEMNRKLKARGIASIGQTLSREEILRQKGRSTESVNSAFKGKSGPKGRFDSAHAKQFARFVQCTVLCLKDF